MNRRSDETSKNLQCKNNDVDKYETNNDLHVPLLFDHTVDDDDNDEEYYTDIELSTIVPSPSSDEKGEMRLITWLDNFCFIVLIPEILLYHYSNITLDSCRNDANITSSLSSWNYMMCTDIAIPAIHGQWNSFLLATIVFLIVSIYTYKISLYHVAPCTFRIGVDNTLPLYKSAIYQCITSLPEIMLIIIVGCIATDHILFSIPIVLLTTSMFSWFTIIATIYSSFVEMN